VIAWIASTDDPRLDAFRHVADPAWIRQHGLFVAEGRLVVERLLTLASYEVKAILVNRAAHDALFEPLSSATASVLVCEEPTLASITGYNFHRGCVALVARPAPRPLGDVAAAQHVLGIESVVNPDNIGGLFRTAAAFGVGAILLNGTSADPLYRKAVRTSMGASLRLPFVRSDEWQHALDWCREQGFTIVALTPSPAAEPLRMFATRIDPARRLLVLVGSEGSGLEPGSLASADARVRIPIQDTVDSLNVVVAAAIALERLIGER
jgi:tRNA G18 (ribose-2'-O)-methylase SpoU